jgi:hypothetical protein
MTALQYTPRRTIVVLWVVLALLAAMLLVLARPTHALTTFTVNSTGDQNDLDFPGGTFDDSSDGVCDADAAAGEQCTLRTAIQQANVTTGADTIHFNIPEDPNDQTDDTKVISPGSPLPTITQRVTIDGYTQGDAEPNTLAVGNDAVLNVELDGTNAGSGACGLDLDASSSVVRGLVINNFDQDGIRTFGNNNKFEGNFLGTFPSGIHASGNFFGVHILFGTNNIVGGTSPEARNLISGNRSSGVGITNGSSSTKVFGNYIGTKKDGSANLGNDEHGVLIFGGRNNTIGTGTAAGANTIAFNGGDGVTLTDGITFGDAQGNRILSNSTFSNQGLGIDLAPDGPNPNDAQDTDSFGPNTLQNKPILTSATTTGTRITIEGILRSSPDDNVTIRFFSNPTGNQGKTFLGLKTVTTDANGDAPFTRVLAVVVPAGQRITATATGPGGNTSEFSGARVVVQQ